jgi:hypothetical protein
LQTFAAFPTAYFLVFLFATFVTCCPELVERVCGHSVLAPSPPRFACGRKSDSDIRAHSCPFVVQLRGLELSFFATFVTFCGHSI